MSHANIAIFVPHNGCPNACSFCNQRVISGEQTQPSPRDVADALDSFERSGKDGTDAELAFFGGSFTAIERGYMISLLEAVQPYLDRNVISGIRCSTRPDCIDGDVLGLLKKYRVTAIELGAQSMDDRVLAMNRRGHTAEDVRNASRLIKAAGIELGLQMMTGLYGDTDDGAVYTARELAALHPATVRIYPTVVLEGTELAELAGAGKFEPQGLDGAVPLCARLMDIFEKEDVRVIRVGLHASADVERTMTGGAYHPALRELCESRRLFERLLGRMNDLGLKEADIRVDPRELSKALGQKRSNLALFAERGLNVRITADPTVTAGQPVVVPMIK